MDELTDDSPLSEDTGAAETVTVPPGGDLPAGEWPFALLHGEGYTTLSRTRTGLLAAIIGGYAELTAQVDAGAAAQTAEDDPLLDARYDFAVDAATLLQAGYLRQAEETRTYDLAAETDEDVFLAYAQQKDQPFDGVRPAGSDVPSPEWTAEVPLVLIRTDYHPYTGRPVPSGRVVFLDPATETTLLNTLHAAGAVGLMTRDGGDG